MDFVAYVAKDLNGRACQVFECGGGLAQDVITTMGQAFELRYKLYLANKPSAIATPSRSVYISELETVRILQRIIGSDKPTDDWIDHLNIL